MMLRTICLGPIARVYMDVLYGVRTSQVISKKLLLPIMMCIDLCLTLEEVTVCHTFLY